VRTSAGRVVVACFASHVHRVQAVIDAAERHGRHIAFVGRSMVRNMGVASDLGYLRVPPGLLVDMKAIDQLPDNRVVLISTGSQGEPLSALARMANRSHHQIRIDSNDTVILASSLIPGNETAIYRVINGLSRWGARVVHKGVARVHVSGHASAGELLYLLNATRPSNVMPVHGEWRHLRAHAELARLTGVPADRIVLAEDGVVVDLVDGKAEITGAVECGYVFVDGLEVGDVGESTLKDRRILGDEGFISITVAVDSVSGKIAGGPEIAARGFSDDRSAFDPVLQLIQAELDRQAGEGVADAHQLAQDIRPSSSSPAAGSATPTIRLRPMIIPCRRV
jgi:ribonuclease J